MQIQPATLTDLAQVHIVYESARATQRSQQSPVWPPFTDAAITREIERGELFCVRDGEVMLGVFSMVESDALIWGADERGAHLYLHRIARNSAVPGRGMVGIILEWAFQQCTLQQREGLRMDTWASNEALIALYVARGFRLVGTRLMPADPRLSVHYHGIELALLEAPCR